MSDLQAEVIAGVVLSTIGGACVVAALQAPQPGVDPLGPGALPMAAALIVVTLSVVMIAQAWMRHPSTTAAQAASKEAGEGDAVSAGRSALAPLLLVSVLTLGYVAALALWRLPYWSATLAFVTLVVWALSEWRLSSLPKALLFGIVLGLGCDYLFTQIFVVDLP